MFVMDEKTVLRQYGDAKETYAAVGVDTETVLSAMDKTSLSLHCWQGDDIGGFEHAAALSGGIMATGNHPGKARNGEELRADMSKAFSMLPGKHRANLHAMYAETNGKKVDRDSLRPEHFSAWMDWAEEAGAGLDFNPTYFSHPMSDSGFTLSSKDESIRRFWVEHTHRCREISAAMGKRLNKSCVHNIWIPDGMKDTPVDRLGYRDLLRRSLDEILAVPMDKALMRDAVEGKLFGIGSESFVVGSHDFYVGYTVANQVMLCMDAGHFHPTEIMADKISALLRFLPELLLHVSRGVRWDSDHAVILSDDLQLVMHEVARMNAFAQVNFALDFFDASINRIMAWVIGSRATLKAIMNAMLEPTLALLAAEDAGNYGRRLALLEEEKAMPSDAVWRMWCQRWGVPTGAEWIDCVEQYEKDVLLKR